MRLAGPLRMGSPKAVMLMVEHPSGPPQELLGGGGRHCSELTAMQMGSLVRLQTECRGGRVCRPEGQAVPWQRRQKHSSAECRGRPRQDHADVRPGAWTLGCRSTRLSGRILKAACRYAALSADPSTS